MRAAAAAFYLAAFKLFNTCQAHDPEISKTSPPKHDVCAVRAFQPDLFTKNNTPIKINNKAIVSDACASFSTLDQLNTKLSPTIESLTQDTDFFSYYRLNLYNECPFWSDSSSMCGNIACAVNTIDNEEDIPLLWRTEELGRLQGPKAPHPNRRLQEERQTKPLQGELGADVGESCVVEYDDECDDRDYCVPEDQGATQKGDYVSLVDNPEKFTGYSGPGANQVWEALYRENCFSKTPSAKLLAAKASPFGVSGLQAQAARDLQVIMREHGRQQNLVSSVPDAGYDDNLEFDDECLEKRVFYRIISGMHASISSHLCWDHLNQTTGQWGPSLECYKYRLYSHPERLSNLYFDYALVLRAVGKARKTLENYTFCSGDPVQDRLTKDRVLTLADKIASGPTIYDESLMFQDTSIEGLKEDFRNRFRNVSRIMDCVGCDKCRLWGKLQTAGYGTALKILFEFDENDESHNPPLKRTEVVALVNTLDRLSHSLSIRGQFETMLAAGQASHSSISTEPVSNNPLEEQVSRPERSTYYIIEKSSIEDDAGEPYEFDLRLKTVEEHAQMTFKEEFLDELDRVWRATKWVLRRWSQLPSNIAQIIIVELSQVWDYWLGIPKPTRWEFRRPSKDEI